MKKKKSYEDNETRRDESSNIKNKYKNKFYFDFFFHSSSLSMLSRHEMSLCWKLSGTCLYDDKGAISYKILTCSLRH